MVYIYGEYHIYIYIHIIYIYIYIYINIYIYIYMYFKGQELLDASIASINNFKFRQINRTIV